MPYLVGEHKHQPMIEDTVEHDFNDDWMARVSMSEIREAISFELQEAYKQGGYDQRKGKNV